MVNHCADAHTSTTYRQTSYCVSDVLCCWYDEFTSTQRQILSLIPVGRIMMEHTCRDSTDATVLDDNCNNVCCSVYVVLASRSWMTDLIRVSDHCVHTCPPIFHRAWLITAQMHVATYRRTSSRVSVVCCQCDEFTRHRRICSLVMFGRLTMKYTHVEAQQMKHLLTIVAKVSFIFLCVFMLLDRCAAVRTRIYL